MAVTLKWKFPAKSNVSTLVYRSESYFDGGNLPALLATVAAGLETYIDATAVTDTRYYYRLAVTDSNLSPDATRLSEIVEIVATDAGGAPEPTNPVDPNFSSVTFLMQRKGNADGEDPNFSSVTFLLQR